MFELFIIPKHGSNIPRSSNRKRVLTICTVGNLLISPAPRSKLVTFKRSPNLLNRLQGVLEMFLKLVKIFFSTVLSFMNS